MWGRSGLYSVVLKTSKDTYCTAFLGKLFHCYNCPQGEKHFPSLQTETLFWLCFFGWVFAFWLVVFFFFYTNHCLGCCHHVPLWGAWLCCPYHLLIDTRQLPSGSEAVCSPRWANLHPSASPDGEDVPRPNYLDASLLNSMQFIDVSCLLGVPTPGHCVLGVV